MRLRILFWPALALALTTWGCAASRLHSASETRTFYTAFFNADRGMIYFIKPMQLRSAGALCDIDFTFNVRDGRVDSLRINLSLFTPRLLRSADSIRLSNTLVSIGLHAPQLLFSERNEEYFVSRFTTTSNGAKLRELFQHDQWRLELHSTGEVSAFEPPKSSMRRINSLRHYLLEAL